MNTYLKEQNTHDRDLCIDFEEDTHTYTITIPNVKVTNEFTSVTTFIHTLFSEFNSDKVIKKMRESKKWIQSKYYNMTDEEIKQIWDKNRDEAAKQGTKMHYDIECFYNKNNVSNISIEYMYFKTFELERNKLLKPYRTEWTVWDEDLYLAGSIDMVYICENTGNLHIYDWKRCKDIKKFSRWDFSTLKCIDHIPDTNFWHYTLQLNIYKSILERKYNKKVDELWLVCLHPDNKNKSYIKYKVPILIDEINDLFEYRINSLKHI